jgi:hypothetical protein
MINPGGAFLVINNRIIRLPQNEEGRYSSRIMTSLANGNTFPLIIN